MKANTKTKRSKGSIPKDIELENLDCKDKYIIVSDDCYWSEEDGGRFSGGALFEKTFSTKEKGIAYKQTNKIDGEVIKHKDHWTGSMPFVDSKYIKEMKL